MVKAGTKPVYAPTPPDSSSSSSVYASYSPPSSLAPPWGEGEGDSEGGSGSKGINGLNLNPKPKSLTNLHARVFKHETAKTPFDSLLLFPTPSPNMGGEAKSIPLVVS